MNRITFRWRTPPPMPEPIPMEQASYIEVGQAAGRTMLSLRGKHDIQNCLLFAPRIQTILVVEGRPEHTRIIDMENPGEKWITDVHVHPARDESRYPLRVRVAFWLLRLRTPKEAIYLAVDDVIYNLGETHKEGDS